jgi:hypothetical protein
MNKPPSTHPERVDEHRRQCLAYQHRACSGEPACRLCGTVEQAMVLASWVHVSWPNVRHATQAS